MAQDTSVGATLVAGTSSSFTTAQKPTGMQVTGESVDLIDITTLSTTGTMAKVKYDVKNPGAIDVDLMYHPNYPPPVGVSETWTLTYKILTGQTNGATLAGTGVCTQTSHRLEQKDVMRGTFRIEFTGGYIITAGT